MPSFVRRLVTEQKHRGRFASATVDMIQFKVKCNEDWNENGAHLYAQTLCSQAWVTIVGNSLADHVDLFDLAGIRSFWRNEKNIHSSFEYFVVPWRVMGKAEKQACTFSQTIRNYQTKIKSIWLNCAFRRVLAWYVRSYCMIERCQWIDHRFHSSFPRWAIDWLMLVDQELSIWSQHGF